MRRYRLSILIATYALFFIARVAMSATTVDISRDVAVLKEGAQKDNQALHQRLDVQDKRIEDQHSRIGDIANSVDRFAIIITILGIILGFGAWISAGVKAKQSAMEWIEKNTKELREELEKIRLEANSHAESTHNALQKIEEVAQSKARNIADIENKLNDNFAKGKTSQISEEDRQSLQASDESLKQIPESKYSAQDWAKRAYAAYSENKLALAVEYFKSAANTADAKLVDKANWLINSGVILGESNMFEAEIAVYDEVISRFGAANEPALLAQVAKSLLNKGIVVGRLKGDVAEIAIYDEVVSRFGAAKESALLEQVAKVLVNKGVAVARLKGDEAAIAVYDEMVSRFGAAKEPALLEPVAMALVNKGISFGRLKGDEAEIAVYDEVVNRFGAAKEPALLAQVAMALVHKGITVSRLKGDEAAIAVYDEVVSRFGAAKEPTLLEQVAKAMVNKGVTVGRLKGDAAAIAVYDEMISRFGAAKEPALLAQLAKTLVNKGITVGRLKGHEAEIAIYDEVVSRFGAAKEPALLEAVAMALVNKGIVVGRLKGDEAEIGVYDEVVSRFGAAKEPALLAQVAQSLLNKGIILGKLARNVEALVVYDDVIKRFGTSTEPALLEHVAGALNGKGFLLLIKGKKTSGLKAERNKIIEEALKCFEDALQKHMNEPIALGNRAYSLFLLNRVDEAREVLRKALKLGGETIKDAELADAAISPVPEDAAFVALINQLWDEVKEK